MRPSFIAACRAALLYAFLSATVAAAAPDPYARVTAVATPAPSFIAAGTGLAKAASQNAADQLSRAGVTAQALAADDFDRDGWPDLICVYADGDAGILTIARDDPTAFAVADDALAKRLAAGAPPAPFQPDTRVRSIPIAADQVVTGDFTHDGLPDLVLARRGSAGLLLLPGDGHGGFGEPIRIGVAAPVTAIAAGAIDRDDGHPHLAVAVAADTSASLLIYDDALTATAKPRAVGLPAAATELAIGRLDDDRLGDLAVLADGRVLVLHGVDTRGTTIAGDDPASGLLEPVALGSGIRAIVLGNFIDDRDLRTEIALLGADGSLQIASRGTLDTRPMSADEIRQRRQEMEARRNGKLVPEVAAAGKSALPWRIAESLGPSAGMSAVDPDRSQLLRTRLSGLPDDDLLLVDRGRGELDLIHRQPASAGAKSAAATRRVAKLGAVGDSLALPLRVGVDGRPGVVLLARDGDPAPTILAPQAAQTYHVTGLGDSVAACTGTSCPTLRSAIIAANANAGADTIVFDLNGTITLSIAGSDNAAASGDLDINDSLTITGNGAANTVISTSYVAGCGDCKVFGVNQDGTHSSLTVSISGVTVQKGLNDFSASCGVSFQETGGGIDFFLTGTGNSYTLSNSTVTSNKADATGFCAGRHGGGINVDSNTGAGSIADPPAGTVVLNGVTVSSNVAQVEGGGINLFSDIHNDTLTNCTVTGNSTNRLNGGGLQIRNSFGGTVSVTGGSYSTNTATGIGGGLNVSGNNHISISGVTASGNSSLGGGPATATSGGGGMAVDLLGVAGFTPTVTVDGTTLTGNHADGTSNGWGGGLYISTAYTPAFTNMTITSNTARFGAGVMLGGGTASLTGGSIGSNTASQKGGGLLVGNGISTAMTASALTISGNNGGAAGGGLAIIGDINGSTDPTFAGTLTASLSRVVGNTSTLGSGIFRSGGTATVQNDWWGCDGFPSDPGCQTGSGAFNAIPRIDLRLTATPSSVPRGQTSNLQARVDINSAGTTLSPSPLVMEGLTVTFASDALGTITAPLASPIFGGVLAKTWTAGSTPGTSTVSATLDSGTQTATILITAPDLTLSKSHTGTFTQGDTGKTYTLTVGNSGNGPSSGTVTVTDNLPADLTATAIAGTGWSGCTAMPVTGPATISCSRSDALAAAASYPALTLTVNVSPTAAASVANVATVSGGNEVNTANDSATDNTTIVQLADLTISKTHVGTFNQGDTGKTYTLTVHNGGNAASSGTVTVTDTLPAGLTATAFTGTGWSGCSALPATGPATISCSRSDALAAGANYPALTLTVSVASNAAASVTNTATVAGGGEVVTGNDSASDPTTIGQLADLTVSKSHVGNFSQGDSADTYTITVSNIGPGPTAGTVTVTDALPAGLTATAISGTGWSGCTAMPVTGPGNVSCSRSSVLAAGASYPALTLTVGVAFNAPASVVNSVSVAGGGEVATGNDTASDPTTIVRFPDLTLAKSHTGNFTQGQTGAQYTLVATNAGAVGVTAGNTVTVADTLPTGLTATAMSGTGWACTLAPLRCTRSDALAAGAAYPAITLTVDVAANAPASVQNQATVSGGGEVNTANDGATDTTTVNQFADLTLSKSHVGNFNQGDTGKTYTLVVHNGGNAASSGTVTVTDNLPAGLTATALAGTGWGGCSALPATGPATLSCTRSDALAAGANYPNLVLTVSVAGNATNLTNTASVAGGGEIVTGNDSASDPTTILSAADLTISKSHVGNFLQGDTADTYTLTVSNVGVGPTVGTVTVTDALPAGLTATAISGTGWSGCTAMPVTGPGNVSCSRSSALAVGASYPALTLTVSVAYTAPASVTNTATVSGGGEVVTSNDTASDPTTIVRFPDLTLALSHVGNFAQGQTGAQYSLTASNVGAVAVAVGNAVTVADTLPSGLTATAIAGTGWNCTLAALTCTRSDGLAAGASFPVITLTVNVAGNAPGSVTIQASIGGGGEINPTNDAASDPTTIVVVLLFKDGFE